MALRLGDLLCCFYRPTVEIQEMAIRRRVREDHTAIAPLP